MTGLSSLLRLLILHAGEYYPPFVFHLVVLAVLVAYVGAAIAILQRDRGHSATLLGPDSPETQTGRANKLRDPIALLLIAICASGACALIYVRVSGDPDTPAFFIWGGALELMGVLLLYLCLRS